MKRASRPAEQLPLRLSLEASTEVTQQCETWKAYAHDLEAKLDSATQSTTKLEARVEALKKDNKAWERSYKRLKAERNAIYLARLSDTEHPLHGECQRLRQEVDSLRAKLYQRVWQELEGLRGPGRVGNGPSKADLTRLVALTHPDKWSHPEASALELAHEVTVLVNKLREGVQA